MSKRATITLGAGCFWGVQAVFDLLEGVFETSVGYAGGHLANPSYEAVCSKTTGHYEVVKIDFDEALISRKDILSIFLLIHDPTQTNGQANDIGPQYLSVIFATSEEKNEVSEYLAQAQSNYNRPIATKVLAHSTFYSAEEYHQHYLHKNPTGYCHINMPKVKEFLESKSFRLK